MARARKLENLTIGQFNKLYEDAAHSVPETARRLNVSPQALNRWLRKNNCKRAFVCVEAQER